MQYTYHGFSQEKLLELELDDRDAALLRFFVDFKDSGKMYSEQVKDETYYWIKYEYVREELPIIGDHFQKDALYRRFKKMADKEVLKHHHKKSGGSFSFYTIGPKYHQLITSSELPTQPEIPFASSDGKKTTPSGSKTIPSDPKTGGSDPKTVPPDPKTGGYGFPSVGGTVLKPEGYGSKTGAKDQSIKDQSTKKIREREDAPALALFFEKFPSIVLSKRRKQDILETVTNLDAWKMTIWWWEVKEYRAQNTENMLDYYRNKAVPKFEQSDTQSSKPPATPDLFEQNTGSDDAWQQIITRLQQRVNRPSFNTWLRPVTAELTNHSILLTVPDETFEYWLQEYYVTTIQEEAAQVLHFTPTIHIRSNTATPEEVIS